MEAKAHVAELDEEGTDAAESNRTRIAEAIQEANRGLTDSIGGDWNLSHETKYQISNRFAWAWKLADLGVPVILVYLGFLNAYEMVKIQTFANDDAWTEALMQHADGIVPAKVWAKERTINNTHFIPLIRSIELPL